MSEQPDAAEHWRWWALAEQDLAHADSTLRSESPVYRWVCVASQQAAEKALKAVLIKEQTAFPRIHDLDRLVLLLPTESKLRTLSVDLASLTAWSIAGRYPADATDATRTDAENALRDARVVLNVAGEALGDAMESEVSVPDEAQPQN
jgi:HEPN domain-containing protein